MADSAPIHHSITLVVPMDGVRRTSEPIEMEQRGGVEVGRVVENAAAAAFAQQSVSGEGRASQSAHVERDAPPEKEKHSTHQVADITASVGAGVVGLRAAAIGAQTDAVLAPAAAPAPVPNKPTVNVLSIAFFAYVGVLVRVGLTTATKYGVSPAFAVLYAEIVGTAIMGFVVAHKGFIDPRHHPLYVGLTTGLCGSITTFSSWNQEASQILIGWSNSDDAYQAVGFISMIVLGIGMPAVSLVFGEHLAHISPWSDVRRAEKEAQERAKREKEGVTVVTVAPPSSPPAAPGDFYGIAGMEDAILVALCVASTGIVMGVNYAVDRYDLLFDCLFAPFGALLRYWLSGWNAKNKSFPLGTFAANMIGSTLLSIFVVIPSATKCFQDSSRPGTVYDVFVGLQTGFCGCLTTVSSFANELRSLSLRDSYIYAVVSLLVAQIVMGSINGGYMSYHTVRSC